MELAMVIALLPTVAVFLIQEFLLHNSALLQFLLHADWGDLLSALWWELVLGVLLAAWYMYSSRSNIEFNFAPKESAPSR